MSDPLASGALFRVKDLSVLRNVGSLGDVKEGKAKKKSKKAKRRKASGDSNVLRDVEPNVVVEDRASSPERSKSKKKKRRRSAHGTGSIALMQAIRGGEAKTDYNFRSHLHSRNRYQQPNQRQRPKQATSKCTTGILKNTSRMQKCVIVSGNRGSSDGELWH